MTSNCRTPTKPSNDGCLYSRLRGGGNSRTNNIKVIDMATPASGNQNKASKIRATEVRLIIIVHTLAVCSFKGCFNKDRSLGKRKKNFRWMLGQLSGVAKGVNFHVRSSRKSSTRRVKVPSHYTTQTGECTASDRPKNVN